MKLDLVSLMLGFGVGYLALTESGRKQLIKVSNQGGELVNKLTDKYIGVAYRDWETDRKSTRLNSSHSAKSRMPSSA